MAELLRIVGYLDIAFKLKISYKLPINDFQ